MTIDSKRVLVMPLINGQRGMALGLVEKIGLLLHERLRSPWVQLTHGPHGL